MVPMRELAGRAESGPSDGLANLKTQFLASLNYEVRTPLTGILGMADLLLETSLDEQQREYVEAAHACAEDLLALFNKTLEYSELAAGEAVLVREDFRLPESLRAVAAAHSAAARAKHLRLICRLDPSLPEIVVGDAARLQSVLSHILDNAVKFTEQGKVELSARCSRRSGGIDLQLEVRDTGIGIPADKVAAAFESFRQLDSGLARRYNGLGLGLPVARKLTALMGGRLWVESRLGGGSIFRVTLPLDLPSESPSEIALS